jgi:hypothetical protein
MARETYVLRDGALVAKSQAAPHPSLGRRLGRAPYIRTDGMAPIRSMADGLMYDSKSAYERGVRAAGCEIVGDDIGGFSGPAGYQAGDVERDIHEAREQLIAGHQREVPVSEILGTGQI